MAVRSAPSADPSCTVAPRCPRAAATRRPAKCIRRAGELVAELSPGRYDRSHGRTSCMTGASRRPRVWCLASSSPGSAVAQNDSAACPRDRTRQPGSGAIAGVDDRRQSTSTPASCAASTTDSRRPLSPDGPAAWPLLADAAPARASVTVVRDGSILSLGAEAVIDVEMPPSRFCSREPRCHGRCARRRDDDVGDRDADQPRAARSPAAVLARLHCAAASHASLAGLRRLVHRIPRSIERVHARRRGQHQRHQRLSARWPCALEYDSGIPGARQQLQGRARARLGRDHQRPDALGHEHAERQRVLRGQRRCVQFAESRTRTGRFPSRRIH